jgi:hypothetical protein
MDCCILRVFKFSLFNNKLQKIDCNILKINYLIVNIASQHNIQIFCELCKYKKLKTLFFKVKSYQKLGEK